MGLFLGASVLSMFELLDLFIYNIFVKLQRFKDLSEKSV